MFDRREALETTLNEFSMAVGMLAPEGCEPREEFVKEWITEDILYDCLGTSLQTDSLELRGRAVTLLQIYEILDFKSTLVALLKNGELVRVLDRGLLATRIAKVCQKKGCFFVATEGALTARVSFKDYGFFIPTDSGGKDVVLQGKFSRESVSKAEADHYAEDLGEATASNPERFQYSIVATAISIPRS